MPAKFSDNTRRKIVFIATVFLLLSVGGAVLLYATKDSPKTDQVISYIVDPHVQDVKLYWQDENQNKFKSISNLKKWLEGKNQTLLFAMNGGMYQQNNFPKGLFVENGKLIAPLDILNGNGNFYLKPNGVFYITSDNGAFVCSTEKFPGTENVRYATQSGPMLLIDGDIHPAINEASSNFYIRNGVGILPDNKIIFVMSKQPVSFYDFATFFKSRGCKNALYLDGLVSRTYLPEKNWIQTDGDFGVIIAVTKSLK